MMLAFYTPYTFSSDFFGNTAPMLNQIADARIHWLTDDILGAINSDLQTSTTALSSGSLQNQHLLDYFTGIYNILDFNALTERVHQVLLAILNPTRNPLTLDQINTYSSDFYTRNPSLFAEHVTENNATTTHIPIRFYSFSTYAELINQALR